VLNLAAKPKRAKTSSQLLPKTGLTKEEAAKLLKEKEEKEEPLP
jgi:hypothetical protein